MSCASRARQRGFLLNPARFGAGAAAGATWDATYNTTGLTYSEGNLRITPKNSIHQNARSSRAIVGKVYFEVLINAQGINGTPTIGVAAAMGANAAVGEDSTSWGYRVASGFGIYRHNAVTASGKGTVSAGGTVMVAVDMPGGKIWFGKNGAWNEGNPAAGTGAPYTDLAGTLYAATGLDSITGVADAAARFSSSSWVYSAPSGFGQL